MKKSKRVIIVLILAAIAVFCITFAACDVASHNHKFGTEWKYDGERHWHECSCGKKADVSSHSVDSWTTDVEAEVGKAGSKSGVCSVCEKKITQTIPALSHNHDFGTEWKYNDSQHWLECSCSQKSSVGNHVVEKWETVKEASETAAGVKRGVCVTCKQTVEEQIPALGHTHDFGVIYKSDSDEHWLECNCGAKSNRAFHEETDWIVDSPATNTGAGSKHKECRVCGRLLKTETIPQLSGSVRTADFYAINDFHGTVDRMSQFGGYLHGAKINNANTVLINSGDMFQGSIGSNSNYGKLLTQCMEKVGFDAMTLGNHEFDWGLDNLRKLSKDSGIPFLGANIYEWNAETKEFGNFASDLAQEYVIKTLDNGLKVGIIGVIGRSQITSISSNLVQTIGFKDPLPIIKDLAPKLRGMGCDIVVVSAHVGPLGLVGGSGTAEDENCPSSSNGLSDIVDAVFCAHTHSRQDYIVDGIPFIQGGSNGRYVSRLSFEVSDNGNVRLKSHENIPYSQSWDNLYVVDELVDNANASIKGEAEKVLADIDGGLNSQNQLPRLVCRAIADYAVSKGYDISLSMVNNARANLPYGKVTYENLYQSLPFDNVVYVAEVSGADILNEARYDSNSVWRVSEQKIERDKTYKIAVIDYLLFHQNTYRTYDYFPSAFTGGFTPVALTNENYDIYNYRLITRDYMLTNKINIADYTVVSDRTNKSVLAQDVTFSDETAAPKHAGTEEDPYDVADILTAASGLTKDTAVWRVCKVRVYITQYIKQSGSSGDLGNFTVKDDGNNTVSVYYISKSQGSTAQSGNWSGVGDLNEGDELLIYAKLYSYNGTPQIGGGYCLAINGQAV